MTDFRHIEAQGIGEDDWHEVMKETAEGALNSELFEALELIANVARSVTGFSPMALARADAVLAVYRREGECARCDGEGRIWNNADPTSGQFIECECLQMSPDGYPRNHPDSRYFWHHGSKTYSRFPGDHTRRSWEPIGRRSMEMNADLPND